AAKTGPISVSNPAATGTSVFSFRVLPPDPRPRLLPVRDVPRDQGGRVVLRWDASSFDAGWNSSISAYRVWRRAPQLAARAGQAAPLGLDAGAPSQQADFWESLAEIPAAQLTGYAYIAGTLGDSSASGNPFTAFEIEALTDDRAVFFFSGVDSG